MTLRYACRYSDGSFNVSQESQDLHKARKMLLDSRDDDDAELVQVDIEIVQSFGRPKLKIVQAEPATLSQDAVSAVWRLLEFDSRAYVKQSDLARDLMEAKTAVRKILARAGEVGPPGTQVEGDLK